MVNSMQDDFDDMVDNREHIERSSRNNFVRLGSLRELRKLQEYLHDGEIVLDIVTGARMEKYGRGIMVATNERLIVIFNGWVFRETHDFSYETISSIEFQVDGLFFGKLTVHGKGSSVTYKWVGRNAGRGFTKIVREIVAKSNFNPRAADNIVNKIVGGSQVQADDRQNDYSSRISALVEARDKGLISFEEFEVKKNHLMNEIAGLN
jgi:hypothetical protein